VSAGRGLCGLATVPFEHASDRVLARLAANGGCVTTWRSRRVVDRPCVSEWRGSQTESMFPPPAQRAGRRSGRTAGDPYADLRRPPPAPVRCACARWRGNVCPGVRGGGACLAPASGGGLRVRSLPVVRGATRAERRAWPLAVRVRAGEARMILVRIAREGGCVPRASGASHSIGDRSLARCWRSDRGGRRERS
jgi:hypothetical protein